ncbi:MAG TPA: NPCBM/NEW2 domain-containing protein [bacterium]|nr:NPCBM/NEW2 domain-containing protein [bacterium]
MAKRALYGFVGTLLLTAVCFSAQAPDTLWISRLNLSGIAQGWGHPRADISLEGKPLTINGRTWSCGLATHAASSFPIDLKGDALRFLAEVGVDDDVNQEAPSSVVFVVRGDKRELWRGAVARAYQPAQRVDLDLTGIRKLELVVEDGGDGINWDHADWNDARIVYRGRKPAAIVPPKVAPYQLTPAPGAKPRINGPMLYGARPGHPFLYRIPATGKAPLRYEAEGLPGGLTLDAATGIITGRVDARGTYPVLLRVLNSRGRAERGFKIVIGDQIALTPPLGWNSWNCFACDVDDAKVRAAADALVQSGLASHGWSYINIDDCWAVKPDDPDPRISGPVRYPDGRIRPNAKFPDMKALCDYVHARGLKIGIYTSPGSLTCAGYAGAWQFEPQDAEQFAEWGVDYLKYDWCSYGEIAPHPTLEELQQPYRVMRAALDRAERDIVFSLCQYGMGEVWKWGAEVGGNCWRTTGDITDTWQSMSTIGFGQAGHESYAGPSHWNDPDMLVVGWVGWGPQLHPSRLTPDEQYTHITLWSLLASPLLIGCDLTRLDAFTMNLLGNDEVLAVNQDEKGVQAQRVAQRDGCEIWARPLADGSTAVGLFNRNLEARRITVTWSELGLQGERRVRDLWRQKETSRSNTAWRREVPAHGAVLVKIY